MKSKINLITVAVIVMHYLAHYYITFCFSITCLHIPSICLFISYQHLLSSFVVNVTLLILVNNASFVRYWVELANWPTLMHFCYNLSKNQLYVLFIYIYIPAVWFIFFVSLLALLLPDAQCSPWLVVCSPFPFNRCTWLVHRALPFSNSFG